jgi:hypothetical protein
MPTASGSPLMPDTPITPDSKDWTWVLERPCPECGFDASSFARESVPEMIRTNAAAWRVVLNRPDAAQRPSEERWSPLEYACHVRDVFHLFDERLALMLAEDDPLFANWDQDVTAVEDRYAEQAPATVLDELEAAGTGIAASFAAVQGAQWERLGRRSDGASFTVESFARYFAHDPIHHLWDVGQR